MIKKILSKLAELDQSAKIKELENRIDKLEQMCLMLGSASEETFQILQIMESEICGTEIMSGYKKELLN